MSEKSPISNSLTTGAADNPISLDSDIEDNQMDPDNIELRVYEVKSSATDDEALESLEKYCSVFPSIDKQTDLVRRSNRKKKIRFPADVILVEEVIQANLNNNIPAICLLLFERCSKENSFELEHSLKLCSS